MFWFGGCVWKKSNNRIVHKFELILTVEKVKDFQDERNELPDDNKIILGHAQIEVYKRDKDQCLKCGFKDHLDLDHIYLFAKKERGGFKESKNIQFYVEEII